MPPVPDKLRSELLLKPHRVIEGDCLTVLPTLEAGSVDAVCTDPPYNVGLDYRGYDDQRTNYVEWCRTWFAELKRVCRGPILITCGTVNIGMWYAIEKPRWMLCWWKPASRTRSPVGFNNWEPVLYYGSGYSKKTVDVIRTTEQAALPVNHKKYPIAHPCPKPVELMAKLVVSSCPPGGTVLDPFLGSGTTLLACHHEGRVGIGIELYPGYCEISRKRLAGAMAGGSGHAGGRDGNGVSGGAVVGRVGRRGV